MNEEVTLDDFAEQDENGDVSDEHPRFGSLPDDWEISEITNIAEVVGGTTPSTSNEDYWGGGIPWATPTDITALSGNTISETEDTITEKGLESASTHLLPPKSVLMTSRATIGKCAINTVEMATNQGFKNLVPSNEVEPWYLYYRMLDTAAFLNSLGSGSTFDEVSKTEVQSVEIPIPPLLEQRKIATILYTVDRAIEKTEEIISRREEIKRGLMQDIFRYGIDSNRQLRSNEDQNHRETKYGSAPKGWEILSLEDIVANDASITYGIVKPGDHYPGGVPVIKVENITNGEVQTGDLLHTDPEIHQKYDRAELKQGDLLFTIRGTVGRMAFVPESLEGGNLTQDTARIRVENANPEFVRYYLETATPHNYFERHTKGQAVQGINLEDLQQVPVHLPPREEQNRIVEIIDSHTEQIQQEREYHSQLKRFKRGLMQDLLSGTVRTTDTNIEMPEEIAQYG